MTTPPTPITTRTAPPERRPPGGRHRAPTPAPPRIRLHLRPGPGRHTHRHPHRPGRPRRPIALAAATVVMFAAAVAAANALTARYGLIPVGLGLTATAGTYAAWFCLLARDWVHDTAGRAAVLAAITVAGIASAVMAGPRLAAASASHYRSAWMLAG